MIYNQRDVWQGRSFDIYGEYSEEEVRLYSKILKPTDVVVEVGGNIGSLMLPLARLIPEGVLMTFEPERTAFYALVGNIAINNLRNVWPFQQAMGEEVGQINIPELDLEKTDNFGGLELDKDYSKCPHYPVSLNTIDNLKLNKCELIKIDVEGMELSVLKGAVKTLEEFSPFLIVEDDRKDRSEELRSFIKEHGYKAYLHTAPFFNPNNFFSVKDDYFGNVVSLNLFCHKGPIEFDPVADFGMQLICP